MKEQEYLEKLSTQIRCKKARGYIKEEVKAHIEDQAYAYIQEGRECEEALDLAVLEMGDPVETGILLDTIHRPKMAWGMLFVIGIISLFALLIQLSIVSKGGVSLVYFSKYCFFTVLGILVMMIVCYVDYSIIAKYSIPITVIFFLIMFLEIFFFGIEYNGAKNYMSIMGITLSLELLMYLYVPIYGAILYSFHGNGYKAVIKAIIFMVLPVWLALRMSSKMLAINLVFILMILLSIGIVKGWYHVNKTHILSTIWGTLIFLPLTVLIIAFKGGFFAEYQMARLKTFMFWKKEFNALAFNQYYQHVVEVVKSNKFVAGAPIQIEDSDLFMLQSDYLITYVIAYYGIIAGVLLVTVLVWMIYKVFKISLQQKNQLGLIMGCGCGLVLTMQVIQCIPKNLGMIPQSNVYLPLFSYGGTGTIVTYVLLGILLSIYRYKDVLSRKSTVLMKKKRNKQYN